MPSKSDSENLKKKIRVSPSLDHATHSLLLRLSVACNMNKTTLAEQIISIALRNEAFIHHLQNINHADEFRIITARVNGEVRYMDAGK
jgi:hypothetical protein